jgi:hypothetical protein
MSYPQMSVAVNDYLLEIEALNSARPFGTFRGGAVIQLATDHYIAALLPSIDPDEARTNCLAYLQDMDLYGWDIVDEVEVGQGRDTMTVLHLNPPLEA